MSSKGPYTDTLRYVAIALCMAELASTGDNDIDNDDDDDGV